MIEYGQRIHLLVKELEGLGCGFGSRLGLGAEPIFFGGLGGGAIKEQNYMI